MGVHLILQRQTKRMLFRFFVTNAFLRFLLQLGDKRIKRINQHAHFILLLIGQLHRQKIIFDIFRDCNGLIDSPIYRAQEQLGGNQHHHSRHQCQQKIRQGIEEGLLLKLLLLNKFLVMITREDCFKVGEVAKTHNLQGEVVITTDSDLLEKYADEPVFLLLDGVPVPFFITDEGLTVRNHTSYIVKFDYVDTLAQAGRLVGCEVLFEKRMLEGQEPEESGYDIFELIGFEVKDQVSEETGEVADVADYSGNVVLTVSIMNKEILLPLSENYICEIDFEHSRLLVQIPRELVELN